MRSLGTAPLTRGVHHGQESGRCRGKASLVPGAASGPTAFPLNVRSNGARAHAHGIFAVGICDVLGYRNGVVPRGNEGENSELPGTFLQFRGASGYCERYGGSGRGRLGHCGAGLVFVVCALVVRKTGTRWIDRLIPTVVMAEIIFVIGCGLATTAVSEALTVPEGETLWQTLVVAGVAFFVVVLCTCFGKRVLNTIPVLAGAAVAYGLSCAFGMVDFTPVAEAAWIGLPEFTLPVVDVTAIVLVSPIAIIVVIEHIGHLFVIGEMTHRNYNPILWRSLLGDGLATTVAGLLGAPPATTFAENIGVLNVTRVYSTQVFWYAAATAFIVGGFCPKLGALVGTIPDPVIGGVSIVIFGLIACNALKMLVEHAVDMTDSRNLIIFGGPAIAAIGMQSMGVSIPVGEYSVPGLAVAALLGIVLNLVLPGRSADAGAEKVPPVPRESYDDLARDFERAENGSNEKGQA